jgi:aminopeptidase N
MEVQTRRADGGVALTAAYLPGDRVPGQAGLEAVAQALPVFADRFGPFPLSTYTQVEGDFYDGLEYSGLSFVGRSYYALYNGSARNLLVLISVHELAHQWWHTQVGSNPSAEPWLDEALATYSELLFLEALYPDDAEWWWAYRVAYWEPAGPVDQPVANFLDFRGYVNAAYLRGALMLHAMRADVGDGAFFAFLRDYAASQSGGIATAADFWAAYTRAGGDAAAVQAEFLTR